LSETYFGTPADMIYSGLTHEHTAIAVIIWPVIIFATVAIQKPVSRMSAKIVSDDRKQVKLYGVADGVIP